MGLKQAGTLIVKGLQACYEHLGTLVITNIVWFFATFSPMFLVSLLRIDNLVIFIIGLVSMMVLVGPTVTSVHYLVSKLLHKEDVAISDLKWIVPRFFLRGVLLVLAMAILLFIIVFNLVFSMNNPYIFVRLLSGIWLYFALFWLAMLQLIFPVFVREDLGVITAIKRTAFLVLDNILICLLLILVNGILSVISFVTVIPFILLWITATATIQNYACMHILKGSQGDRIE